MKELFLLFALISQELVSYGDSSGENVTTGVSLVDGVWTECPQTSMQGKGFMAVASSSSGANLAALADEGIYTSSNFGEFWTYSTNSPVDDSVNSYWSTIATGNNGSFMIAAMAGGSVFTSSDFGLHWRNCSGVGMPNGVDWWSVEADSTGQHLAAAALGDEVYVSADFGASLRRNRHWV
jgi:hypothetical protein